MAAFGAIVSARMASQTFADSEFLIHLGVYARKIGPQWDLVANLIPGFVTACGREPDGRLAAVVRKSRELAGTDGCDLAFLSLLADALQELPSMVTLGDQLFMFVSEADDYVAALIGGIP